jgi:hypothetical protein
MPFLPLRPLRTCPFLSLRRGTSDRIKKGISKHSGKRKEKRGKCEQKRKK